MTKYFRETSSLIIISAITGLFNSPILANIQFLQENQIVDHVNRFIVSMPLLFLLEVFVTIIISVTVRILVRSKTLTGRSQEAFDVFKSTMPRVLKLYSVGFGVAVTLLFFYALLGFEVFIDINHWTIFTVFNLKTFLGTMLAVFTMSSLFGFYDFVWEVFRFYKKFFMGINK